MILFEEKELYEIPDFEGYYASKDGKIYSTLARGCRNRYDLSKRVEPKELNYRTTKAGYCRVCMRKESTNQRADAYVHRVVAQLFIPNPDNLSDVNHKDSKPSNNNVDNLEWMMHKDNLDYGISFGNRKRNEKGQFAHK